MNHDIETRNRRCRRAVEAGKITNQQAQEWAFWWGAKGQVKFIPDFGETLFEIIGRIAGAVRKCGEV